MEYLATFIVLLVSVLAMAINGLKIDESFPASRSVIIKEGENLSIWCKSDAYWEWCKITHVGSAKSCEHVWNYDKYNVKEGNCNDFGDRFTYIGDRGSSVYKCGILITDMTPKDEGEWNCDIWGYSGGSNKSYKKSSVSHVSKSFEVHIAVTTTSSTTSTTTTSTTTPTSTTSTTTTISTTATSFTTTITTPSTTRTMSSTPMTTVPATTTITTLVYANSTVSTMNTTEYEYEYEDAGYYDDDSSMEATPSDQSNEGNGTPGTGVAIVAIILLVIFALAFVFFAKRHNKFCFRKNELKLYKEDDGGDVELAKPLTNDRHHGVAGEDDKPESDQKPN